MLFAARFSKEPKTVTYRQVLYTINYGEFIYGRSSWAGRLKIGEQKLRTLLKNLEDQAMIQTLYSSPYRLTIYKIVNYEKYNMSNDQAKDLNTNDTNDKNIKKCQLGNHQRPLVLEGSSLGANHQPTISQPSANHQVTITEERKNLKNDLKDIDQSPTAPDPIFEVAKQKNMPYNAGFTEFWTCYPRKVAKKTAQVAWAKLKPDNNLLQKMLAAIKDQKTCPQWTRDNGDSIPHPATWLNGERWTDETQKRIGSAGVDNSIRFDPEELEILKERERSERQATSSTGEPRG
jgi:hypothetical protein